MKWTAMILIAAQTACVAQTATQKATPQQKQELSQYDFKGAAAALNAQSNQPAQSPASLTRIPPLQVPPLTTRSVTPTGSAGRQAIGGPEVPAGWQPPHADLDQTAASAVAVARDLDTHVTVPTPGSDGRVVYLFGQGTPVMVCAPLRVCAVELEAGEHLQGQPQIGDSRRWEVTPVLSGAGLEEEPVLVVKPVEAGLETDLIVPTDRRTYVVKLVSDATRFIARLAFQYPDEERAKWAAFEARQDAVKHDAEVLAEQQKAKDKEAGVLPMAGNAIDNLYFDYKLKGNAAYLPERVLDDGVHTYLIYPNDGRFREMPTLLLVVHGKTELVNFRVDGPRYVVDRLFDKAVLVVGVGKKQARVTITRLKPYTGGTEKSSTEKRS
jgi:type IV secretion system protein VirB9